ncbi:aminotransferase class V-fold PLP-dependent enzyme [Desulfosporosinus shakirovi]|uniref:aminotransferase class V-fold PLP-dependent enzyme n=1 Tax=Desulfosporosinus shakirovi TaxID=2885154 RepID=UPI001E5809BB|nr:aminotransferase class V-fold PLP-dependent enzyme [Desulfosporosinus sp. SRJS8]MCB8816681.1 aminotransferase class V-fold PLP-dependent enzyme [Desulfosporosinus sp. SRJS8]
MFTERLFREYQVSGNLACLKCNGYIAAHSRNWAIAHEYGAYYLLDAAQTAGVFPIDMGCLAVDLLAFEIKTALLAVKSVAEELG